MTTKHLTIYTANGIHYATAALDTTGDVYWIESDIADAQHWAAEEMRNGIVGMMVNDHAAEMLYRRGLLTEDTLGDLFEAFDGHLDRWTINELAKLGI